MDKISPILNKGAFVGYGKKKKIVGENLLNVEPN
jgi:hypothetical protein